MHIERLSAIGTLAWAGRRLADELELIVAFGVVGVLNLLAELSGPAPALAVSIASLLGSLLVGGIAHAAAFDAVADPELAIGDRFGHAASKLPSLVGVAVVYFLAVFVGTFLLIVPGIYLALRLSLSFSACVIDDRGVADSLRGSWAVASGNLLKIFGVQLAAGTASIVALVAAAVAVSGVPEPATIAAATVPVTALVGPIAQLALGRIYVENDERLSLRVGEDADDGDDEVPGTSRTAANW